MAGWLAEVDGGWPELGKKGNTVVVAMLGGYWAMQGRPDSGPGMPRGWRRTLWGASSDGFPRGNGRLSRGVCEWVPFPLSTPEQRGQCKRWQGMVWGCRAWWHGCEVVRCQREVMLSAEGVKKHGGHGGVSPRAGEV